MITFLQPGLVLKFSDPGVRPIGKEKWHLCVCEQRRWFLRINSRPLWRPHALIQANDNPWLKHDSYVELRQVCTFPRIDVEAALADPQRVVGRIGRSTAALLIAEIRLAVTLTDEEKDIIAADLATW